MSDLTPAVGGEVKDEKKPASGRFFYWGRDDQSSPPMMPSRRSTLEKMLNTLR
ncbi:hypothetical protein RCH14_001227 [Massilia sp. MP_M2]